MAKKYYICDIIGDGQDVPPTPTTGPFRPVIADLGVSWVGSIPSDPVTGHPLHTWTLVLVNTDNHAKVIDAKGVDALPDFPLDGKVNAINNVTKSRMNEALVRRGINTDFVSGSDGYRDVIRGIGQKLEAAFDENNFDVA
ncbi:hypothetical protein [Nitrosovibrio sp. Nv4]|uniref:hypothetical protein n=1 Tax=Nitrosovibrio sp. Nv4 TaxID=1945880 RepID=UPI000BCBE9E0|nr:hypothetical protein [Nitrosovibrio sp. Nv4]SOD42355.1 hypothetical protein SAMN06298226_2694 [Nitrosovibrio sp. Nv4]